MSAPDPALAKQGEDKLDDLQRRFDLLEKELERFSAEYDQFAARLLRHGIAIDTLANRS